MDRKEFRRILGVGFSFGLVALGAYNLYWFACYFMHGRDIGVIPPKRQLFLADIIVLAVATVIVMLLEMIGRRLRRSRYTKSHETEDK